MYFTVNIYELFGIYIQSIDPSTVSTVTGSITTYTVTLNRPAPSVGATVSLDSSNTSVVSVPTNVVISSGTVSSSFTATAGNTGVSVISAVYNGTVTALETVNEITIISVAPDATIGLGGTVVLTATLNADATSNQVVSLSSSDATKVEVPANVIVLSGNNSETFTVTGVSAGAGIVTGTLNGTASATITVAALTAIAVSLTSVTTWIGSPDGATWVYGGDLSHVAGDLQPWHMPGSFIVATGGANFDRSADGASWSTIGSGFGVGGVSSGAWAANLGVGVQFGYASYQAIWSNDGITWHLVDSPVPFFSAAACIWMADSNQKFVYVPQGDNAGYGVDVGMSTDGQVWYLGGAIPAGYENRFGNAVWAESQIVTTPVASGSYQYSKFSLNGVSYIQGGLLPTAGLWKALCFAPGIGANALGRILSCCQDSSTGAFSDDRGASWVTTTLPAALHWSSAAWTGEVFVIAGGSNTIYISPTGETGSWTAVDLPGAALADYVVVG